jgi:hypothetical protein
MLSRKSEGRSQGLQRIIVLSVAIVAIIALLVIVTLIVVNSGGEAEGRMEKNKLEEHLLRQAKEMMPETADIEEDISRADEAGIVYFLKDNKGKRIGWIHADPVSGDVYGQYDYKAEPSDKINIDINTAREIAGEFLASKGKDTEAMLPQSGRLRTVTVAGDPADTEKRYQYDFIYRPKIDGVPVYGGPTYFVSLSPHNGNIIIYGTVDGHFNLPDKLPERRINKEKAIDIAMQEAQRKAQEVSVKVSGLSGKTVAVYMEDLSLFEDEVELRYQLKPDGSLSLIWSAAFAIKQVAEGVDNSQIKAEPPFLCGYIFYVDAESGEIFGSNSF